MVPRFWVWSLLLLVGAACAYLAGNGRTPLFDRDEPRYALTSRNMLASGDFVVPRQYDRPRTAKPPLIYWVQAGAMELIGRTSAFAARLPSSVAMWLVLLMLLVFLRRETDELTALIGAGVFGFSGLALMLAKVCITDAVLLTSVSVALWGVYRIWRGDRGWGVFVTLGLAVGAAGLTKGPVVLGLLGMTAVMLLLLSLADRKWPAKASWRTFDFPPRDRPHATPTWVKALVAAAIVAAVVLPWVVMVERAQPGFLTQALSHDVVKRSTKGVDGQARPPGFYLLTVFGTFFPWSLLIPAALLIGWKERHRPLTRFCLAATVGMWLMFEAVTSKMVHWFLPALLPLSILTADAVVRCWRGKYTNLSDQPFRIAAAVFAGIIALIGLAPWVFVWTLPPTPWWPAAVMTLWGLTTATACGLTLARGKLPHAVAALAAGSATFVVLAFTVVLPSWWFVNLGPEVGKAIEARGPHRVGEAVMIGFKEPSTAFYQGGSLREAEAPSLLDLRVRTASVSREIWEKLSPETRAPFRIVSTHRGIAYADDPHVIEVLVVERR